MVTEFDHKISARELLEAFNIIQQHSEPEDGVYVMGALRAESGHDGYTVTIRDDNVDATVGFHNSVQVNAASSQALEMFKERLDSVIRSDTQ